MRFAYVPKPSTQREWKRNEPARSAFHPAPSYQRTGCAGAALNSERAATARAEEENSCAILLLRCTSKILGAGAPRNCLHLNGYGYSKTRVSQISAIALTPTASSPDSVFANQSSTRRFPIGRYGWTNQRTSISRRATHRKRPESVWRPRGSPDAKRHTMPSVQEPVPGEAFTSVRCLRDAAPTACSADILLPDALRGQGREASASSDDARILQHPLAAHVPLWTAHVHRLVQSSTQLAQLFPELWGHTVWSVETILTSDAVAQLWEHVQAIQGTDTVQLRASLRLAQDGSSRAAVAAFPLESVEPVPVRLDTQPTSLQRTTVALKTDLRAEYDASRQRVHADLAGKLPNTCFDALLWKEGSSERERWLTEASIANIVLHVPGQGWFTPPFDGLLPGLLVQELVRSGRVQQQPLAVDTVRAQLASGAQLWLGNAVRGLFPVVWE